MTPEVRLICPHGIKTLGKYVGVFLNPSKEEDSNAQARFNLFRRCDKWQDTSLVTHVAVPYQSGNNLPCVMGKVHSDDVYAFCAPTNDENVTVDLKRALEVQRSKS